MPPYMGLTDSDDKEIKGKGYYRRDLSEFTFKISPPKSDKHSLVFTNTMSITWCPQSKWPRIYGFAVYPEADSPWPIKKGRFPQDQQAPNGSIFVISPGFLNFEILLTTL